MTVHGKRFTLIELLIVIAIIAILAGILLPALATARDHADKTKAKMEMNAIKTAIASWQQDYGTLPLTGLAGVPNNADYEVSQNTHTNHYDLLIWTLQNYTAASPGGLTVVNPRGKAYLDIDNSKLIPKDGDPSTKHPFMFDPWSNPNHFRDNGSSADPTYSLVSDVRRYHIVLDMNYDHKITSGPYQDVFGDVAVWCEGKDRDDDDGGKGDVNSWE